LPQPGDDGVDVLLVAGALSGKEVVQPSQGDDATSRSTAGASIPTPQETGPAGWQLAIATDDNDNGHGAATGVMPSPSLSPPEAAAQSPPPLSLDSMVIGAAEAMAIAHGDQSSTSQVAAVAQEGSSGAMPAETVAATQPSTLAVPAPAVSADDSVAAAANAAPADPFGSSVRTTIEDLDRLSGVA
jgi:hypothetical protein